MLLKLRLWLAVFALCFSFVSCHPPKEANISQEITEEKQNTEQISAKFSDTLAVEQRPGYEYYQNWRSIARILFEDKDSVSIALYKTMVTYVERIKNQDSGLNSEQMLLDLSSSFQSLRSPNVKSRIDSLLTSNGLAPFYNVSSEIP